ncbi:TPA: hypothetical protein ACH3X3_002274 [Trebouxia sp. C0006]
MFASENPESQHVSCTQAALGVSDAGVRFWHGLLWLVQLRQCRSGAAMYTLAPDAIYARRSRHAYGVQTTTFFKKGHREELRFTEPTTNKILCSKVFSPLVKLDELVEHDQVKVEDYVAVKKHQASVDFNLYACSNNSDRYTDADAMKKVGSVRLYIADPSKVTDPDAFKFTVSFRLGGSELTVTAVDKQTGEEVQTSVIFVAE